MNKIYQPIVIERTNQFIEFLNQSDFFKENEINNLDFTKEYLLDKLTEKFISGELNEEVDELFPGDEFGVCIKNIIIGTVLKELRDKGMVNSYEDDDKGELYFITEKGKKYLKDNNLSQD